MDMYELYEELENIDDTKKYRLVIDNRKNEGYKNQIGTSKYKWKYGSWKEYWNSNTEVKWPKECCVKGCNNEAIDGGHVEDCDTKKEYILPLCARHNNYAFTDEFEIKDDKYLVSNNTKLGKDLLVEEE